jgi:hypothetical protein
LRRNLSDYAKGVLALALKPLVEEKAKANQRLSEGAGKKVWKNYQTFLR